ncbi:MAG: heavy-metal-associated domain-containing protein [Planctomycetes bacterium]|nr:heavy-metal-associated domain-containing protein [Planctomycetota bacterium]
MKILTTFAVVSLLAIGCQGEQAPTPDTSATVSATPVTFNTGGAPTVTFEVPDMMCQYSCVDAVKTALASQPGVREVRIDFEARQATVVVDQATFNGEAAVASLVDYQFTNSKMHQEK